MSGSSQPNPESGHKVILLQRGSELSEFADCLTTLGMPFANCSGWPNADEVGAAQLIVASAQRLLESGPPDLTNWPRTLAVVQDPSKTLSSHLNRIGVGLVLSRPIHPRALRLLLLHEIYQGPERRNRERITIGHPVRIKIGLFAANATLLELSPSGARVQVSNTPKIGQKVRLILGRELSDGRPLKLAATVVRRIDTAANTQKGLCEIGLSIQDARRHQKSIKTVLERFASGPAVWRAGVDSGEIEDPTLSEPNATAVAREASEAGEATSAAAGAAQAPDEPAPSDSDSTARRLPRSRPRDANGLTTPSPSHSKGGTTDEEDDRRADPRIPYSRRVVALDEEAARVLVGRDLSQGGMRIMSTTSVAVGDDLRVALHCGTEMEPLVVIANVLRDDGDNGLVLTFQEINARQLEHLEKIIASSGPIRATTSSHTTDEPGVDALVVGELLD